MKILEKDRKLQNVSKKISVPYKAWCVLIIIVLAAGGIRYRSIDVPLERDEGEYAYAGQLIRDGIPPYEQVYNMKLPGIYVAYSLLLSVFGETHTGIHIGLIVINAITIVLIFLLSLLLMKTPGALVAAASFALLSLNPSVQGIFANAEHFVILFAVGGIFFLLKEYEENRLLPFFFSGLLLGIGILMKQHGAAFVVFGALYIVTDSLGFGPSRWKLLISRILSFISGVGLIYGLTCLILVFAGVFKNFWFWTVNYSLKYISLVSIEQAWINFKYRSTTILASDTSLWSMAVIGLFMLIWKKRIIRQKIFIIMFILFSFLSICPGFYFRSHYFILLLPVTALLVGFAVDTLEDFLLNVRYFYLRRGILVSLAVICLTISIYQNREYLFQMTPSSISRLVYGYNPFPEALEIARYIREHTEKSDRIAVLGSEPQIFFYSNRRSASGYIYMYPLMESHDFAIQMQRNFIKDIITVKPKFLVFVNISTSWLQHQNSPALLLNWFKRSWSTNFKVVGLVTIWPDKTVYQWGENLDLPPLSSFSIAVFERRKK